MSLVSQFKTKTRDFLKRRCFWHGDVQTGKIKLFPSRFGGGKEIQDIFNVFEDLRKKVLRCLITPIRESITQILKSLD